MTDSYKILILGDNLHQNLNLLCRAATGTVNRDFYTQNKDCSFLIKHNHEINNHSFVKLQIWVNQSSGPESKFPVDSMIRFRTLKNQAAIILYEITNKESFEICKLYVAELQKRALPNIVIALVGYQSNTSLLQTDSNNSDISSSSDCYDEVIKEVVLPTKGQATPQEVEQFCVEVKQYAIEIGALHFQVCLETGENVDTMLNAVVSTILERSLEPLPKYIIKHGGHDKSKDTWDTIHCMIM